MVARCRVCEIPGSHRGRIGPAARAPQPPGGERAMGLDNVAVQWPRTGRFYEPVAADEFSDFADFAAQAPVHAGPAAALASHIAKTGTVRATAYTDLIDLLLGLEGVLYATDAATEDEDPVIDPDG